MSIRSSGRPALVAVLSGTLLLGPNLPSRAEQAPRVLVVGPIDSYGALVAGVSEGLQSAGFAGASRIRVDVRNARSADEAKAAVGGAVDAGVDAIVTIFGPSTQAARTATTRLPIVFCPVADPVAAKLVASNEAPGGNLTGVASADAEASRRRLAAFRQVLPGLKRLAVLFDPGFPPDRVQLANLEQVASSSGLTLVMRAVGDANAAVAALRGLGRTDADAVFVLKEALLRRAADEVGRAAIAQNLPILVGDPDLVTVPGVVAAVGPSQQELGKICGRMTARILQGAKPADLSVEHPVFELLVNLKSAGSLGVAVPERALEQAVRVIR
jgi:putative ABC transport system substrate-binding protein